MLGPRRWFLPGAAIGIAAAVAFVWSARVPDEPKNLLLAVDVVTLPSGEFAFEPRRVVRGTLSAAGETSASSTSSPSRTDVPRDRELRGSVRVRNQSARTLGAQFRVIASEPDVEQTIRVVAKTGTRTVLDGDLRELSAWSAATSLPSAGTLPLEIRVTLQRSPDGSYHGLGQRVSLSLEVRRVR